MVVHWMHGLLVLCTIFVAATHMAPLPYCLYLFVSVLCHCCCRHLGPDRLPGEASLTSLCEGMASYWCRLHSEVETLPATREEDCLPQLKGTALGTPFCSFRHTPILTGDVATALASNSENVLEKLTTVPHEDRHQKGQP